MLVLLVLLMAVAWACAGFAICRATHQQRGLEVDPWDYLIPDFPPDDLLRQETSAKRE